MARRGSASRLRAHGQQDRVAEAATAPSRRGDCAVVSARGDQAEDADAGDEQHRSQNAGGPPRYNDPRMTPRRIALCLTLILTVSAVAQKPNFKFFPGPKPGGGEVTVTLDEKTGEVEAQKDEYSIFQGGVTITYQDIKL